MSIQDRFTYGVSYISGFIQPFLMISNNLFGTEYPQFFQKVQNLLFDSQEVSYIGTNIRYNAFTTLFYQFYNDFGVFGVFIESMIFAFMCKRVSQNMCYNSLLKDILLFMFILQVIFTSIVRWQFVIVSYSLAFIYILIIFKYLKNVEVKI